MVTLSKTSSLPGGQEGFDLESWLEQIAPGRSEKDLARIRRAYELALRAHEGQQRATGEPYMVHCVAVAGILADLKLDSATIAAAILHDVVEDTRVTLDEVTRQVGKDVAHLVDGVTKIQRLPGLREGGETPVSRQHLYDENLRKMLLAMAEDVRVVLIKLADRTHNMRTLKALSPEKQQRIARETLEIVAPLANRLGIWQIKWELEDLALKYLDPEIYHHIASKLDERRVDRERYLQEFIARLGTQLEQAGVKAEIKGRPKHIYSIWRKMERKQVDFEHIFDVRAVRILVDDIANCYAALGVVHSLWPYVRGEFDDYIATPKDNDYRSLHTAVVGAEGKVVEVQIRTHDMNQHAELGVAAHWRYKEGAAEDPGFERKLAWLRQVLEWQEEIADAGDFVAQFKTDVLSDRVYALTPAGKIIDLPQGATPVDFAYYIHTEVGHRCRGAEVNGRIVPLNYTLKSGDQVKIVTLKSGGPSRDWLNPHLGYVQSSRARSQIQHWFKQQNYEINVHEGRQALDKELARLNLTDVNLEKLAQRFNFPKVDDFFSALGRNDVKVSQVVNSLQESVTPPPETLSFTSARLTRGASTGTDIQVYGMGDMLTHLSGCCKPVPGEPIIGYITRGRGVGIHRQDCASAQRLRAVSPQRIIEVDWASRAKGTYPVEVQIEAADRAGLLRDIAGVVTNENINLLASNTFTRQRDNHAFFNLTLEIVSVDQLSRVLTKLNQLPNVIEARRRASG